MYDWVMINKGGLVPTEQFLTEGRWYKMWPYKIVQVQWTQTICTYHKSAKKTIYTE